MAYSYIKVTAAAGQTSVPFDFDYLKTSEIRVTVNGVETTAWSLSSPNVITFNSPLGGDEVVEIERVTNLNTRAVDFSSGAVLTEEDLDLSAQQVFNAAQEAIDSTSKNLSLDYKDEYDAKGRTITGVAKGVNPTDVITKEQLDYDYPAVKTVSDNMDDVNTVVSQLGDINRLEDSIDNIDRLADSATRLDRVHQSIGKVDRVHASIDKLDRVDDSIDKLDRVFTSVDKLDRVHSSIGELDRVEQSIDKIESIYNITYKIDTIHDGYLTELDNAYVNRFKINHVSDNISYVQNVSDNMTDVNTVANISVNVSAVGDNINDVTTVAQDITTVRDAADNLETFNTSMIQMATFFVDSQRRYVEVNAFE